METILRVDADRKLGHGTGEKMNTVNFRNFENSRNSIHKIPGILQQKKHLGIHIIKR